MSEEWRPVLGYEDIYEISSLGNLRSIATFNGRSRIRYKKSFPSRGYQKTILHNKAIRKSMFVHIIVAEAFIGAKPSGKCVNHKNGNKSDNRIQNLEYATLSENQFHSYNVIGNKGPRGEKNGFCRHSDSTIREVIERVNSGERRVDIARDLDMHTSSISAYVNGHARNPIKNKKWPRRKS